VVVHRRDLPPAQGNTLNDHTSNSSGQARGSGFLGPQECSPSDDAPGGMTNPVKPMWNPHESGWRWIIVAMRPGLRSGEVDQIGRLGCPYAWAAAETGMTFINKGEQATIVEVIGQRYGVVVWRVRITGGTNHQNRGRAAGMPGTGVSAGPLRWPLLAGIHMGVVIARWSPRGDRPHPRSRAGRCRQARAQHHLARRVDPVGALHGHVSGNKVGGRAERLQPLAGAVSCGLL
jgi:hypothetical protein